MWHVNSVDGETMTLQDTSCPPHFFNFVPSTCVFPSWVIE
uniref:Uncharacterized protein n=1 Tax=Manihot esculenta TaxID=3983 RepID=A0A2C9UFV0_MANES